MALTSTDQFWGEKLKIAQQETEQAQAENAQLKLMISGATGQGGSPGQKYKPPVTNPGRGEAVFGTGKDGQRYFEFLKAMTIDPANNIRRTGKKPLANDDDYGEGEVGSGWKISKEPVLPNFKPMGREIKGVRKGVLSPEENKVRQQLQIGPHAGASSRQIRDRLKGFTKGKGYDDSGGSLRGIPDSLRIQLLRDAMAQAPANDITRFGDSGHMLIPGSDGAKYDIVPIIDPTKKTKA